MRLKIALFAVFFSTLSIIAFTEQSKAQDTITVDLFYQELSPYGEWTPHPDFGYIWQPYQVGPEWKPYTNGRWEWSDQGWLWISYEPWGWATYHYGRWVYDDYQGWIWIPGTTWAPAWVSWQQSPEYIGWSPLPPDRGFFIEIGFVFNSYNNYYYKPYRHKYYGHKHHYHKHKRHKKHRYYHNYYHNPHHYKAPAKHSVYLPHKKFGHHKHAGKAAVPPANYDIVLRNNRNVTNIKRVNNKVINYGPDKHFIEKRSNRKFVSHKIVNRNKVRIKGNKNVNIVQGNRYEAYRPNIQRSSRDPFTTNRSQINRYKENRQNINKPRPHRNTQFNNQVPKTKFNSTFKNQANYRPSVKTEHSKKHETRRNSSITNRNNSNQYQRRNVSKGKIRTGADRYDKYSYKSQKHSKLRQTQKGSDIKSYNVRGKKVTINKNKTNNALNLGHKNTVSPKINKKSGFDSNNKRYKGAKQISNNKYKNRSYSNNRSVSKKRTASQGTYQRPNIRTKQTPKNPAFSRR